MNNYGLVFRDATNGWILLGEFVNGTIDEFVEISDHKYDNLPETMFSVVDIQHENGRLGLMDLHRFEMFNENGAAVAAVNVIRNILGMPDGGKLMFSDIYDQIVEELFSGTKH